MANRITEAWKALTTLPAWPERSIGATKTLGAETLEDAIFSYLGGGAGADTAPPSATEYETISTMYACAKRRGSDLASGPIVIEAKTGKDWTPVEPGEKNFGDVAGVFERANRYEGRTQMWTRFHMGALVHPTGTAYIFTDYENGKGGETPLPSEAPKSLHALITSGVMPIWPPAREPFAAPLGYVYSVDGAVIPRLLPEEIYRYVVPDPNSTRYGLSPATAAIMDARTEREIGLFQREYFVNGARGSIAILSDKAMGEEQRNQFKEGWREDQTGLGKRQGLWLLTGGLKPFPLDARKDGDFPELKREKRQSIAMVYGVPLAFLMEYGDSGVRANFEEQTPIYVEGTLEPDWKMLEEGLTEIVLPRFARGEKGVLRARIDRDKVPMIQRMMLERAKVYETLSGGPILTPDEAREDLRREPLGENELRKNGPVADPNAGGEVDDAGRMTRVGKPNVPAGKTAGAAARKLAQGAAVKLGPDPIRNALRGLKAAHLDVLEAVAKKDVRDYFDERQAAALSKLPATKSYATKDIFDDLWDDEEERSAARDLVLKITARVASRRGPEAQGEVGMAVPNFTIDAPEVVAFLDANAYAMGKVISGTSKETLARYLTEAIAEGRSTTQDLASAIADAYGIRRSQALTIARTEVAKSYNTTSVLAWDASGLVEKIMWLTAHDDAVRSFEKGDAYDHAAMDGVVIKLGGSFAVPGEHGFDEIGFPGDGSGDPANTINCRCVAVVAPEKPDPDPGHTVRVTGELEKMFAGGA